MMSVYMGAIQDSRKGPTQYVIERGLEIFRTDDKRKAMYFLNGGWNIKAVCDNGVMECSWRLDIRPENNAHYNAYLRIAEKIDLHDDIKTMVIRTQEFYTKSGELEGIQMSVTCWNRNESSPELVWITPKKTASADKRKGQGRAQEILEILLAYGVKQDKDAVLRKMQSDILFGDEYL